MVLGSDIANSAGLQPTVVLFYVSDKRVNEGLCDLVSFSVCLVFQSCLILCDPMGGLCSSVHGDSLGKNLRVGCHALLQGIFPTEGLNPALLHYRQILYGLSHQGSMNAGVGTRSLLQEIFLTQESNWSPALQADSLPAELPSFLVIEVSKRSHHVVCALKHDIWNIAITL